jgi:hypothetical protein
MVAAKIRIVLGGSKTMTCAEFQKHLPEYMEEGFPKDAEEHLKQCSVCSDLVEDLKYIAEAAKLLVPMHDPSPRVWEGIERSLKDQRGSTLRPAGGPGRPEPFLVSAPSRAHLLRWSAVAAAVVIALALISYRAISRANDRPAVSAAAVSNDLDSADEQLLNDLAARHPAMRQNYEQSIRNVNAYIRDTRQALAAMPGDPEASSNLMNAYEQKAAIYEMASTSP